MSDHVEPDTKDWTWVLRERCGECGFDASTVRGADLPGLVAQWVPRWEAVLARPEADVRPRPGVWSPLEYACHVRDVLGVFAERVRLMLDEDDPTFPNWDQDAAALEGRYGDQERAVVAEELAQAGAVAAQRWADVGADDDPRWERRGLRSNGSAFTVRTLGQYFAHDVVHHLHDVDG